MSASRQVQLVAEESGEEFTEEPSRWPRVSILLGAVMLLACGVVTYGLRASIPGDVEHLIEEDFNSYGANYGEQYAGDDSSTHYGNYHPTVTAHKSQVSFGNGARMEMKNGFSLKDLNGNVENLIQGLSHGQASKDDFQEVIGELLGASKDDFQSSMSSLRQICKDSESSCKSLAKMQYKHWKEKLSRLSASDKVKESVLLGAIAKAQCALNEHETAASLVRKAACEAYHKWEDVQAGGIES